MLLSKSHCPVTLTHWSLIKSSTCDSQSLTSLLGHCAGQRVQTPTPLKAPEIERPLAPLQPSPRHGGPLAHSACLRRRTGETTRREECREADEGMPKANGWRLKLLIPVLIKVILETYLALESSCGVVNCSHRKSVDSLQLKLDVFWALSKLKVWRLWFHSHKISTETNRKIPIYSWTRVKLFSARKSADIETSYFVFTTRSMLLLCDWRGNDAVLKSG